jgi:GNAT superfamily N-acetyltransferase
MRELSSGWATDLAVLAHGGSTIEDHDDHLVVRTPANPEFHWGNCLFVTDERMVDDAARWVSAFRATFPDATWVAIGLVRMPAALDAWAEHGLGVELDDVLTTRTLPRQTPLTDGYTAGRIEGDDWEQYALRAIRENEQAGEFDLESHERFVQARTRSRRTLSERDIAAFFGAFVDGRLVADLGIVRCGRTARYQTVGTDPDHRRRGLASHLLGLAARWAADRECDRWVIVTETTNPAGRLYRNLEFDPDTGNAQAYRRPLLA